MLKNPLPSLLLFFVSISTVNAAFVVDIYDSPSFWHTDTTRTYMDSHAAVGSYEYDVLNFSDWGDKGFFADENLWPIANTNTFSAHITGFFDISETGNFDFATWSDDGIDVLIDGNRVINRPKPHAPTLDIANLLHLTSGLHYIDIIWYENGGAAVLELSSRQSGTDAWQLLEAAPNTATAEIPEPNIMWYFLTGLLLLAYQTISGKDAQNTSAETFQA